MRGRTPVGRWLVAAFLLLLVGGAALAYAFALPLVRQAVVAVLERSGLAVRNFEIRSLGWRQAEFANVKLGSPDGPVAASVGVSWSFRDLWAGRVDRLIVRQPKLSIVVKGSEVSVSGLPSFGAKKGGVVPFQHLDLVDGTLTATTTVGDLAATLDAAIANVSGVARVNRLDVRVVSLEFAGGTVSAANFVYQRGRPLDAVLAVNAVDLGTLLAFLDVDGLSGSGRLDGTVPVHLDDKGGVRLSGGRFTSRGPGVLRYTGDALPAGVPETPGGSNESVTERIGLARRALADFHYDSLFLDVERAPSGEGTLIAKLAGRNPAVLEGHPINLNIRFETNFDRLASILSEAYSAAERLVRPVRSK